MKFQVGDKEVTLQGMSVPQNKVVNAKEINRDLRKEKQGILLQLYSLSIKVSPNTIHHQLQQLLTSYADVFAKPTGLPPHRSHDHRVSLVQGSGPVCVRPYIYPHFQKNEIERLVSNMLSQGIIHPSPSPYSSPIILVKKHDGSWRLCIDYRALNQITIKYKFTIPVIDELLDELHEPKSFLSLICDQAITKYACIQVTFLRQRFKPTKGIMNFW